MAERTKFVGVNSITFNQLFKTEENCLEYLSSLKWMKVIIVKDVRMINIVRVRSGLIGVVQSVGIKKALQLELCLTR